MINSYHAMLMLMLSPILTLIKSIDTLIPYGTHSMFQKLWRAETESALQSLELDDSKKAFEALDLVNDAIEIFTKEAENQSWIQLSVEQRKDKVIAVQNAPQIPQRSQEWFENYTKVLTASEFSALFAMTKRRRDLVYSKVNPCLDTQTTFRHACPTNEMNAIGWGIRFETVVKQLIEHEDKCKIYEPGRIQHPRNTHLAASPDGLIESASNLQQLGRLVEIKCPYSRVIGKEIPSDYWIQMQIQMEVTDIDECEYIEANIVSRRATQTDPVDLSGTTYQGILYLLQKESEYKYVYGDIGSKKKPVFPKGYECLEEIPWGLKSWHRVIVQRDRRWYEGTKEWQEAFWRDVELAKKGELTPHTNSKPTACLITDD
jgi:putative phage-type endonuclease